VGGGVNGAALARLAAFQGLKVGLFESGDFGQGASSNTSKLLHGGLRYLESFEFGLVRESVRERARLLKLAPHLVEERRFQFPFTPFSRQIRPLVKMGMMLYDGLSGGERLSRHGWISAEALGKNEPGFLPGEERGAYGYADCVVDDARLVLENILDAEALGAQVANWHTVTKVHEEGESHVEVTVLDRLTGREKIWTGSKVAMLLGPWTDQALRGMMGMNTQWVRKSQGIHLIVEGLSARDCFILPVPKTKRYFFVIPFASGRHLVGTTETELSGDLAEEQTPSADEIKELQHLMKVYFPNDQTKMICTIAGVRPLAQAEKGNTSALSREHVIHRISNRIYAAVGGKYTTHRPLAEHCFEDLYGSKPLKSIEARALPGAWSKEEERLDLEKALKQFAFMNNSLIGHWLKRYGKRAMEVAQFIAARSEQTSLIDESGDVLWGEIDFAIEHEYVKTPVDFLRRRTRLFFTAGGGLTALPKVNAACLARYPTLTNAIGDHANWHMYLNRYCHCSVTGK